MKKLFFSIAFLAAVATSFTACKEGTCGTAMADLMITSLAASNYSPNVGETVDLSADLYNAAVVAREKCGTSNGDAGSSETGYESEFSNDGVNFQPSDDFGAGAPPVAVGQNQRLSRRVRFTQPGYYRIRVRANRNRAVQESNYDNNQNAVNFSRNTPTCESIKVTGKALPGRPAVEWE